MHTYDKRGRVTGGSGLGDQRRIVLIKQDSEPNSGKARSNVVLNSTNIKPGLFLIVTPRGTSNTGSKLGDSNDPNPKELGLYDAILNTGDKKFGLNIAVEQFYNGTTLNDEVPRLGHVEYSRLEVGDVFQAVANAGGIARGSYVKLATGGKIQLDHASVPTDAAIGICEGPGSQIDINADDGTDNRLYIVRVI